MLNAILDLRDIHNTLVNNGLPFRESYTMDIMVPYILNFYLNTDDSYEAVSEVVYSELCHINKWVYDYDTMSNDHVILVDNIVQGVLQVIDNIIYSTIPDFDSSKYENECAFTISSQRQWLYMITLKRDDNNDVYS